MLPMVKLSVISVWTCLVFAVSSAPLVAEATPVSEKVSVETAISNAEQVLKGRTVATLDPSGVAPDGVVIEYFEPNGKVYRWYPGYGAVLRGTWAVDGNVLWLVKVSEPEPPLKLCRQISSASGPEYPRSRVRTRDCSIWKSMSDTIVASTEGDFFKLSLMKTPCRLCTSDRTIEKLNMAAEH
ncbi:MAG: hypothetical protein ABJ018_02600 [Paracoccaceae bacterium]